MQRLVVAVLLHPDLFTGQIHIPRTGRFKQVDAAQKRAFEADHPAVTRRPIFTAPMRAVLPLGHTLAEKPYLEPGDFDDQPFVALGSEISTRSETDAFIAAGKVRPRVVAEAQLSASICELMAGGAGVAIVEPVTAANFAAARKVVTRPLRPEHPFQYDMLLPALRQPSRLATRFLELVDAQFARLLNEW